ncbi:hypothetical protein C2R22_21460 (plasmid) [Salinigranum rubrum]|uniref:S-layer glycoprotein n=1 Tax=Salinigranum rubrum TaxID=755307 RepID=A0A2I8VQE6_9EURY|nr:PGF-CTERM sorting domain-containing protein [Salinigranum rubrum]AUV84150.1 hypothetical protein C2R22_21460 [Salinigranum rubrum]
MTDRNHKIRAAVLAALLVLSVFAGTVTFVGTAAAIGTDISGASVTNAPIDDSSADQTVPFDALNPSSSDGADLRAASRSINSGGTVYIGEEDVDLTSLPGVSAGNPAIFTGVSGSADGSAASVSDGASADITSANNFEPGGYDSPAAGGGGAELFVVEPLVSDLTIYSGAGTDRPDVTDGSILTDTDTITIEADWNFDDAENVSITIEDEDGLEVQSQLTSNTGLLELGTSGGNVELSGLSDLETGEYLVTVKGVDNLDSASRSATFTIRDESQSISLSESSVTQGENVVATTIGAPGAYGLVRIDSDHVENLPDGVEANSDASAENVFANTGDVAGLRGAASVGATDDDYVGAIVDLGDTGDAQVRINTEYLDTSTVDVEFVELDESNIDDSNVAAGFDANSDDNAELTIEDKAISIVSIPSVVRVGEDFEVEGTAAESDEVAAYARIDDDWELLDGDENPVRVDSDGSFVLELTASSPINLPDNYRVAVVTEEAWGVGDANADEFPTTLDSDAFGELETKETVSIRTVESDLTAQLSSQSIAADVDDEITVSGLALGQGNEVRIYKVGPRGDVQFQSANIDDGEFEADFSAISHRGTHTFLVIGEGRDGNYAVTETEATRELSGEETPRQAVAIINDLYSGAGVDDQIVELTLQAENPQLSIDDFATDGQVAQGEVTVSGTSNREDGTTVFIEILGDNKNVITSKEAEVNGSTGAWSATLDMSGSETGTYTLRADDDETAASLEFELVESLSTPVEGPMEETEESTESTDQSTGSTMTSTPTESTVTSEPTGTSASAPGFGVVVTLVTLMVAALLAIRRD